MSLVCAQAMSLFLYARQTAVYLTPMTLIEAVMESTRDYMRRHRNACGELARTDGAEMAHRQMILAYTMRQCCLRWLARCTRYSITR